MSPLEVVSLLNPLMHSPHSQPLTDCHSMVNDMAECFALFLMVNKTETKVEHDPNVFVRIKPSFKSPHHSPLRCS